MKKVFLILLMSAAILSGSMMLPASTEKASAESTVTVGGNINWGFADHCFNSEDRLRTSWDRGQLYYGYAECIESGQ